MKADRQTCTQKEIILRRYSALREVEHNSPHLHCRLHIVGWEKNSCSVEQLDKRYLCRLIKVNISSDKSC